MSPLSSQKAFNIRQVALGVEYDREGRFRNSRWNLHKDVLVQLLIQDAFTMIEKMFNFLSNI